MHSNHLGTLTVSSKLLSSNKTLTVRIWSQQFVYISKRGIDEQEVRQYFADMLCTYINVYTYKQYMLKRLGTIAGYEHISCSRIVQGTLLQDSYSDLVQAQLDSLLETRALSRLRVRFSSMQQQTQHIICVSIADHSRRWLLPSYGTSRGIIMALQPWTRASDRVLFLPTLPPCGIISSSSDTCYLKQSYFRASEYLPYLSSYYQRQCSCIYGLY